jgi:isocitrate dehydrogenase kinase/phosphatase
MFEKLKPYETAYLILDTYIQYHHQFKRVTKRAKIRFEQCDWQGMQNDSRERSLLYRDAVGDATRKVVDFLGPLAADRNIWREIKEMYLEEIFNFNTRNIAETFYNSVFRHAHKGLSADVDLMFVTATGTYREFRSAVPIYHTFFLTKPIEYTLHQILSCYSFDIPFENLERDIWYIAETLRKKLHVQERSLRHARIEMLKSVFYRSKGAYLVGRLYLEDKLYPFILPLLNEENGIFVDTILLEANDASSLFSYNRAYFQVDTDIASDMVDFLRTILPFKSLGELYNSIGFEKHGKTVLYRDFLRHTALTSDKFTVAPGIKGMVMAVFTLPSYSMVFKLIKDRFQPPKNVTEQEVREKYELVNMHDRVGRMADSHMFENFVFDRKRFDDALVEELLRECPSKVKVEGDKLEIKHLYIEKRMTPLNLYLETATPEQAAVAIRDYGRAIKDMAAVNIFPGDMLLKNFGVTRLNRVVFYDYDEIGFITDYHFRRIPVARHEEDEWAAEPWYSVGPNDVFPEEFTKFLIGRPDIREMFLRYHADLYDVTFWHHVQDRLRRGEIVTVFPYSQRIRFSKTFKEMDTHAGHFEEPGGMDEKQTEWPSE